MTRLNKIAFAAFALALTLVGINSSEAGCGRGGYHGSSISRSYGSYSRPTHQPIYHAPTYHAPAYSQPAPQPQFMQPTPQQQLTQPTPQRFATPQAPQTAPVPQPAVQQQQFAAQPQAPQTGQVSAMDLALQALGDFTPQQAAAPQVQQTLPQTPVGNFQARLTNGSVVQLNLANNGQFTWSATNKDGKISQFTGTYNVGNGSLTLARSADSQKLAGNLSDLTANGFRFKIGSSEAALSFVRS